MEVVRNNPVASGMWGEIFTWEVYASSEFPPTDLTTAVACVALAHDIDGVVLTRNQRGGWEVLAGHIEEGEDLDGAMRREALEEGGYTVTEAFPIGYRKITAIKRPESGTREANYPYPTSYIAYYLAKTDRPTEDPTGEEILESKTFSQAELDELAKSGQLNDIELVIIHLGMAARANLVK